MDDGEVVARIDDLLKARQDFEAVRRHAIVLLDGALRLLRTDGARRTVNDYVRAKPAFQVLKAVPWSHVRDILGIEDAEQLTPQAVWTAYRSGEIDADAAAAIQRLREVRYQLAAAEDFEHGWQLAGSAVRIGLAVAVAGMVAAPLSAYLVGEPIAKEIVKAVTATVVTVTAAEVLDHTLTSWRSASATRPDLVRIDAQLQTQVRNYRADLTRLQGTDPYQECVARLELLATIVRAQQAHLSAPATRTWPYLQLLDRLTAATTASDRDDLDRCSKVLADWSSLLPAEADDPPKPGTPDPAARRPGPDLSKVLAQNRPPAPGRLPRPGDRIDPDEPAPRPSPPSPPAELAGPPGPRFDRGP